MTHDFKVHGQATLAAGWLSFYVDRGNGTVEEFEEVAVVAFAAKWSRRCAEFSIGWHRGGSFL